MHTIVSRSLEFDAGHRLLNHEGKCANLHGHRYKVEVEATADELDDIGRVIDFSVLKERLGGWIERNWDHAFIANSSDDAALAFCNALESRYYRMASNPTAENMARHLLHDVCPALFNDCAIVVVRVVVWETPNCRAIATRSGY